MENIDNLVHNSYETINNIRSSYRSLLETILILLVETGEKKYTFEIPISVQIHTDEKNGRVKQYITSVEFVTNKWFDITDLEYCIRFNINEDKSLSLHDINVGESTFLLYDTISQLKYAKEEKNVKNTTVTVKNIVHFENKDIIITDPCYIIKEKIKDKSFDEEIGQIYKQKNKLAQKETEYNLIALNGWDYDKITIQQIKEAYDKQKEYEQLDFELSEKLSELIKKSNGHSDWDECDYGENMKALGINNYICRNTIYGDWSCTTFDTDTNKSIGEFCADAGMVAVFDLEEVLKYNPDFDYHINRPWTTTLIKNFTGDVWFEVEHTEGVYEDTTEYHKKGDKWEDNSVHVIGKGNINFKTSQTGL